MKTKLLSALCIIALLGLCVVPMMGCEEVELTPELEELIREELAKLQGEQGEPGPAGPQGEPGPAGSPGAQGEWGPQGATGPAGGQGEQGSQGEPGPQGEVGPRGSSGSSGSDGSTGASGAQGTPGETGSQGEQGESGIPPGVVISYTTIQDAIEAASPGDIINVPDGTYSATPDNSILLEGENLGYVFIHIDKPITLIGESRDGVILDGTGLQGEVRSTGIWVSASNVTVKNLTIQNFEGPPNYSYGLYVMEKFRDYVWETVATLQYVTAENLKVVDSQASLYFMKTDYATVKDCVIENSLADGIWVAWGSNYATVQGNAVTNSGDHGIWVGTTWMGQGHSSNTVMIIDNIINGAREGGISFVNSDGATISGNTITNVASEGWSVGALSLKDGPSNVEAYDNTIYNNNGSWGGYNGTGHGVGIDGTPSNINLYLNNIYGNTGYGVYNYSTVDVTATNNWWGTVVETEILAMVSGLVDFDPWSEGSH